jgi:hypothetical protein
MADGRPVRECGPPDWLAAALSKAETNKRKRAEEERLERLAVNRAVAASLLLPPPARMHVRVPDRLQELEDEIRAAAPEPPPLPVVMAYYPAAAEEARVSAVEYKLVENTKSYMYCIPLFMYSRQPEPRPVRTVKPPRLHVKSVVCDELLAVELLNILQLQRQFCTNWPF